MTISKRSVMLLLISVLTYGTAAMALIYYLPRYLRDYLGFDLAIVQLVTTIYPFSAIFLPQILGKYSDKIQNRYLFILIGSIGASILYLALFFTKDLVLITFILIIYSMCGVSYRLSFTLYQELTKNNPKFVTFYNAANVFGWFLGSQFGGIFIDIYEISNIYIFLLIISLINLVVIIFIRENRNDILNYFNNEIEISNSKGTNFVEKNINIAKSIYVALFTRHFGVRPIITILAVLMSYHLSSDTQIGFLLGFNPLVQFFLMLLTGKIISKRNEKYILMIGFFLSTVALIGYMLSTDFLGFLFSQIMISSSFALFWNATQIYIAQKTNPRNKGKYLGYANSSFFSGGFIGGLFFSLLLTFNPDYYAFMWIMLFFPLISTLSIFIKFKSV
ncbi:MAG: MFS transporter [Candidatus Thorarchaeota archaeon]